VEQDLFSGFLVVGVTRVAETRDGPVAAVDLSGRICDKRGVNRPERRA